MVRGSVFIRETRIISVSLSFSLFSHSHSVAHSLSITFNLPFSFIFLSSFFHFHDFYSHLLSLFHCVCLYFDVCYCSEQNQSKTLRFFFSYLVLFGSFFSISVLFFVHTICLFLCFHDNTIIP